MKTYQKRNYIVQQVLKNPEQVLGHLSQEDFLVFEQLVDAGPGMNLVAFSSGAIPPCVSLDLIDYYCDEDERKEYYFMTDDLREAVRPYLNKASENFANKFRFYIENLILGLLNIYGCLTETQLKSMLKDYMELEDDGSGVLEHALQHSAAIQLCCYDFIDDYEETMYASPFIFSIDEILAEREKYPEIKNLKHFDKEEVLAAGMMPTPEMPNPKMNALLDVLEKEAEFTSKEAILTEFSIWQLQQHVDNPIDVISPLLLKNNQLTKLIPQLTDYLNHSPKWRFCGYSSDDLFQMNKGIPN